jgi:pseudouridine kinase
VTPVDAASDLIGNLTPEKPVLVIGAAGLDIVGRLRAGLQMETSNPAYIRTSFGGVARNIAENLARLGQPVWLLSSIGQDQAGDQLVEQASKAGVMVDGLLRTSEHPTSSYLAVIDENGKLQVALDDMRAMTALTPETMRAHIHLFKEASLLFVDANVPKDTLRVIMSQAKKARLLVCGDPTAVTLAHRFIKYLPQIFLFTPNGSEASVFCECPFSSSNRKQAIAAAKMLVSKGVKIAIITLGEHGVVYATSQTSGFIPALRTRITDPTGAGDAMTAAMMFALLNRIPIDEAVRLAVSAASLTLTYKGAVVPDLSLEKLYDRLVI